MTTKGSNLLIIIALLGALFFGVSLKSHAEGIKVTSEGIQFSDGTLQTTKAIETGTRGFGLYDGNGVFIGYLLNEETVFRADISAFFSVDCSGDEPTFAFKTPHAGYHLERYWKSSDCTGTTYCFMGAPNGRPNPFWLHHFLTLQTGYFLLSQEAQKVDINDMQSRERWDGDVWVSPTGQCESYTGGDEGSVFELRGVVFPLEGVSLSYPLSVK